MSKQNYLAEIETTVAGIPCFIAVTEYEPYVSAYTNNIPERCHPAEGGYGEYRLLDRKGYLAKWLERKVNRRIDQEIQDEIFNHMEEQ